MSVIVCMLFSTSSTVFSVGYNSTSKDVSFIREFAAKELITKGVPYKIANAVAKEYPMIEVDCIELNDLTGLFSVVTKENNMLLNISLSCYTADVSDIYLIQFKNYFDSIECRINDFLIVPSSLIIS